MGILVTFLIWVKSRIWHICCTVNFRFSTFFRFCPTSGFDGTSAHFTSRFSNTFSMAMWVQPCIHIGFFGTLSLCLFPQFSSFEFFLFLQSVNFPFLESLLNFAEILLHGANRGRVAGIRQIHGAPPFLGCQHFSRLS